MGYRVELLSPAHHARVAELSGSGADRLRDFLRGVGQPYDRTAGVAVVDEDRPGFVLGYALVGLIDPIPPARRSGHAFLHEIRVDPAHRRRGAGVALVGGLLDRATLSEGIGLYAAVAEPAWDVMATLRAAGRGRSPALAVIPGARFEAATFPPVPFAILARGQSPDRHIFHFPAPARARLAAPGRRTSPRPGRKWSYGDLDRRAS